MPRARKVILAGTGHRHDKLGDDAYEPRSPIQDWVRREIRKVLKRVKPDVVISGMALGFDQWLALEALDFGAKLHAYIPFEGQEARWWGESKKLYFELLAKAKVRRIICPPGYEAWKMQRRNEEMMDDSTVALSCWDGSAGGTGNCVAYADSIERKRINIDPREGVKFIDAQEQKMHDSCNTEGGWYCYLGNLRWQFKPTVKCTTIRACVYCKLPAERCTCIDGLPF